MGWIHFLKFAHVRGSRAISCIVLAGEMGCRVTHKTKPPVKHCDAPPAVDDVRVNATLRINFPLTH
jgi:hypothetical protein